PPRWPTARAVAGSGSLPRLERALGGDRAGDRRIGAHRLDREHVVASDAHLARRLVDLGAALGECDRVVGRGVTRVLEVVDVPKHERSGERILLEVAEIRLAVLEED